MPWGPLSHFPRGIGQTQLTLGTSYRPVTEEHEVELQLRAGLVYDQSVPDQSPIDPAHWISPFSPPGGRYHSLLERYVEQPILWMVPTWTVQLKLWCNHW